MIIQIINLSYQDVFKTYSSRYKIYRDVYQKGLFGLELRDIRPKLADIVQKIVLKEKQICYKHKQDDNHLNLFIPGSIWDFKDLSRRVLSSGDEDLGYKLINVIKNYEEYELKSFNIGDKEFLFNNTYIMGIINVTPDSFSDGGLYNSPESAVEHALNMINSGVNIVDIGGESTRPGSKPVPVDEEISRVIPVVEKILSLNKNAIISVDTTKSKVAGEALKAGAKIINDISAGEFDPEIINVTAEYNAALILMHMKGTPADMQVNPFYTDVVEEIYDFLFEKTQKAAKAGVKNIFVDPGIGFGKRIEDNFEIIRRLEDFKCLGYPVVIGISRKSFIGKTLGLDTDKRDTATAILESVAVKNGARIIRTHNTFYGLQVTKLLNNIL
ncbi:MAG: dihydropteroate synthase [Ignavibacteriaceae bacterium]